MDPIPATRWGRHGRSTSCTHAPSSSWTNGDSLPQIGPIPVVARAESAWIPHRSAVRDASGAFAPPPPSTQSRGSAITSALLRNEKFLWCVRQSQAWSTCVLPTSQLVGELLTDSGGRKETHRGASDVYLLPGTDPDSLPGPHLGHLSTGVIACHTS